MTNKEAIKYLQQLYTNGGHCWLDEQRIEAIGMAVKALQEEPVSEDLDVIAREYAGIPCDAPKDLTYCVHDKKAKYDAVLFGAQLQKEQMMQDAASAYIRRNKHTKKNVLNGFDVTCEAVQKFKDKDKVKVIIIKEDRTMPARHPIILNGMGLRGLMNESAEAMIAASVDAVSKAQDDDNAQDLKEQFERQ